MMNDHQHDLCTQNRKAGQLNRFTFDACSDLTASDLANVRRAQFAAYWNAPFTARDADILAAIYRGWYFLEREQFPGVLMPFTAFER